MVDSSRLKDIRRMINRYRFPWLQTSFIRSIAPWIWGKKRDGNAISALESLYKDYGYGSQRLFEILNKSSSVLLTPSASFIFDP